MMKPLARRRASWEENVIRRTLVAAALLSAATLVPPRAAAANKDMQRLQLQVAALQSQLLDVQRNAEESRRELQRLSELLTQQNALLQRVASDHLQQQEAVTTGFTDLNERMAELAEAVKSANALLLPPAGAPATAGGTPSSSAGSVAGGGAQTPGSAGPTTTTAPPPAPRELYSQAYSDYGRGNYDLAIQGFSEYIRNYPGTDFTDNAQYWIGECQYGKKAYAEAIESWNALFRDYPSSDKLPEARWKKGQALEKLGRRSQALVEYRYVIDRFPNTQAARLARERLNP
jgi:tol-pal system protein YbgF